MISVPSYCFIPTSLSISSRLGKQEFPSESWEMCVRWMGVSVNVENPSATPFIMSLKAPLCTDLKFVPRLMISSRKYVRTQFLLTLALIVMASMYLPPLGNKHPILCLTRRAMRRRNTNPKVSISLRSLWSLFLIKIGSLDGMMKENRYKS